MKVNQFARILCILVLTLMTLLMAVSCDLTGSNGTENYNGKEYTVTFDSAGGSEVESQTVKRDGYAVEPVAPTRNGYKFDGWYSGEMKWNFSEYAVRQNLALVAKWSVDKITHTVTFDAADGTDPITKTVSDGEKVSEPSSPTHSGYRFIGWYLGENEWNFTNPVLEDMTLTAKWEAREQYIIYDSQIALNLIFGDDVTSVTEHIYKIIHSVEGHFDPDYMINYGTAADIVKGDHEIVVGKTDREISALAYAALEEIECDCDDPMRYLVYSDGSSVAIAYAAMEDNAAIKHVVEYFVENYVSDKLVLEPGVVYEGYFSLYEYYLAEDAKTQEKQWQLLEIYLGDAGAEIVAAMKELYSIYDSKVIEWYANLFDPNVGGYYYSNSARDNVSVGSYLLLPDAESTNQALNFLSSSGMIKHIGSYKQALPEWMKEKIIEFIMGLQNPNGYFYHPQWGVSMTDDHLSRRARDLNWCTSILANLGRKPTYDAPNGYEGSGLTYDGTSVAATSALYVPLGTSAAVAVSHVVATASVSYEPNLQDDVSFRKYLNSLDITNKSYSVGNELTSQTSQISTRDKQLAADGADYKLMDILIEWLNEHQNPETGHWHYESNYYGVNGLLKISGIYNAAGVEMPYAEEAAKSAMDAIVSDETMGAVVDLYNTWFSISNILTNIRKYASDGQGKATDIVKELRLLAPEAIRISKEKISAFEKSDGSFSYTMNYSSSTSQGMPVSIPNTVEGDVNATGISITGLLGNIYSALAISDYRVNLFGKAEWLRYLAILEENRENGKFIDKSEAALPSVGTLDFDDITDGQLPTYVTASINSTGGSAEIAEEADGDNAIKLTTASGANDTLSISMLDGVRDYDSVVFEADIRVESSNNTTVYQINFYNGSVKAYMLNMNCTAGRVSFYDCSSTGDADTRNENYITDVFIPLGTEFRLKVEYLVLADGVEMRVYINNELKLTSSNFYNSHKDGEVPQSGVDRMSFYALRSAATVIYIDNVSFKQAVSE